jgi:hypothetical protein
MKNIPTIIKRGRIIYVLYPEKVIVGVGLNQWISYNQYDNWNRQGITRFRKKIIRSKDNEYTTPTDYITLTVECGIRGTSTTEPRWVEL